MVQVSVTGVNKSGDEVEVGLRVTLDNGDTVSGSATCWPESAQPFGDSIDMWLSGGLVNAIGSDREALYEVEAHVLEAAKR